MNVLVLCTGNSARSIMLEAILGRRGAGRLSAHSAGSRPVGQVHPQALALLRAEGFDTSRLRSKSWNEFAVGRGPAMDVVITVCAAAAGETCPVWPGGPLRAHWGVDDPAAAREDQAAAFRRVYDIDRRAAAFCALQPDRLTPDVLARHLRSIGEIA